MPKKLLIIDGNSIVNRAFFGVRPLTTRDGLPTNAVYGFLSILHRHLTAVNPDYAAIAYDLREPTFRHKLYDGYKANRHGMPDELAAQMPWAKKCAHALGLTELTLAGYEADDILGTMARRAEESGAECCILTGDRDSLQLISDTTCVLLATNTETVTMDRRAFSEKYGIRPEQFVDVKALMGDSSDNIPGVAGVGEKTALKLISQMGTLENVYADLAALPVGPSVRAKLEAGHESALLSRTLAQICTDAPVPSSVEDCAYHGIDRAELYELCTRLEFSALVKRLGLEADPAPEQILPVSSLTDEQAQALPAEPLYAALYTGSDFLLCDGAQVYHVSAVPPALRLCVHDAKAFYRQTGIREQIEFDLSLAAYLLAPSAADYAPDRLCVTYLGTSLSAGDDAAVTAFSRLAPVLQAKLDETNQASLLRRIELPLAFVLADMEKCGFLIYPEAPIRRTARRDCPSMCRADLFSRHKALQHQFSPSARRGSVRDAGASRRQKDQDRLLHQCRGSGKTASLSPHHRSHSRLPPRGQAEKHLCGRASAGGRRHGTGAHLLPSDRHRDRQTVLHRAESAKHSRPHPTGTRNAPLLLRRARLSLSRCRLFADRTASACPHFG